MCLSNTENAELRRPTVSSLLRYLSVVHLWSWQKNRSFGNKIGADTGTSDGISSCRDNDKDKFGAIRDVVSFVTTFFLIWLSTVFDGEWWVFAAQPVNPRLCPFAPPEQRSQNFPS